MGQNQRFLFFFKEFPLFFGAFESQTSAFLGDVKTATLQFCLVESSGDSLIGYSIG